MSEDTLLSAADAQTVLEAMSKALVASRFHFPEGGPAQQAFHAWHYMLGMLHIAGIQPDVYGKLRTTEDWTNVAG